MMKDKNKMFCFSPPVMVATFFVEIVLLVYVLWRYKLDRVGKISALLLLFLALFQIAESQVCGSTLFGSEVVWHQIGYTAITMLPPLGLHLFYVINKRTNRAMLTMAYLAAASFVAAFVLVPSIFITGECNANYAILRLNNTVSLLYPVYYFGLIAVALMSIAKAISVAKSRAARPLYWLGVGYLVFLAPTLAIITLRPSSRAGVPSMMCGFAVLFAFIVVLRLLPLTGKLKKIQKNRK